MVKIVLTFDDNKWNHYHTVFPLLKKYKFKATFAYITNGTYSKDEENFEAIKEILDYGIEICSHSHSHLKFDFSLNKPKEIINDLIQNERKLYDFNIFNYGIIIPYNYLKIPHSFFNLFNFKYIISESSTVKNFNPNPEKKLLKFTKESEINKFNLLRIEFPLDTEPFNNIEKFYNILNSLVDDEICVIMFHNVSNYSKIRNVKVEEFENLLKYLHEKNFTVTTLKDLYKF